MRRVLFLAVILAMAASFVQATTGTPSSRLRSRKSIKSNQPIPAIFSGQSATLLPNGTWLLLGGKGPDGIVDAGFLLDPSSGAQTPLAARLTHARAWHTATLLPDGTVFVLGGVDQNGHIVGEAEVFNPQLQKSVALKTPGLAACAHHTATLLVSGAVLIAGGVDTRGEVSSDLQFWDPITKSGSILESGLLVPTRDQVATLQANGDVLFVGGTDKFGAPLNYNEVFDHVTERSRIDTQLSSASSSDLLSLNMSIPDDRATAVPTGTNVALLFSKRIRVQSLNDVTASLSGPSGPVRVSVVPAEGGRLGFVTPSSPLAPGTSYTLLIEGISDQDQRQELSTQISFTTAGTSPSSGASGNGMSGMMDGGAPFDAKWQKLPPLKAPQGVTALAGQTLQVSGKPLKHVKIEIEDRLTFTDDTGRFLLKDLTVGHHVMNVYGESAVPNRPYGFFQIAVDIDNRGETTILPFTMFIPVLDVQHATHLAIPTTKETVATTPLIPGLEIHIPAGEILRWVDGKPLESVTLTQIPMMQMPMPGPPGVETPISFTLQADGAVDELPDGTVGAGIRIIFPNIENLPPGTRANFWTYDPKIKGGWFIYGQGSVTADGKKIVPDPGVVIHRLSCSPFNVGPTPPGTGPRCKDGHCEDGDPVDISTGLFVYKKTDLVVNDRIPIVFGRTYRQLDGSSRDLGIGTQHSYGAYLYNGQLDTLSWADLVFPDGGRYHYVCISSDCSGGSATVLQNSTDPGPFYMSQMSLSPTMYQGHQVYNIRLKDGTIYGFMGGGGTGRLAYIRDRNGNQLSITMDNSGFGKPVQITTPGGRWITLTYDTSNRVTQIQDNIGRTVSYAYDSNGYLHTVTDAGGGVWTYAYDPNGNMTTITDARQILYLTNQYDSNNRVFKQTQADNSVYQFAYTLDTNGNVIQTNVTHPRGDVRIVTFNSSTYWTSDTADSSGSAPQTVLGARQTNTNLVSTLTDVLGRETSLGFDSMGNVLSVTRMANTSQALTTSFTYDSTFNQVTSITDPLGHAATFGYDSNGNLTTITDPLNNQTTLGYNAQGLPTMATDALGNSWTYGYDSLSFDLTSVTDSLNRTTARYVDNVGRLVTITDPALQIVRYAYNPLSEITSVTDPKGNLTSFGYDPNGNLLSVTDANNHQTQYTYDSMDRVATRKDPLLNQESYQYDVNGNVTQFTDRRGKVTTFSYDTLNRLTFAGYGTQAGPTYESTVTYTYDAGNRLTKAVDSISGTITRGYDVFDRVASETSPQGSVSYSYDGAGRRVAMNTAGQATVDYGYDAGNRLTQITQGTSTVGFTYDVANRRTSLTLPNGVIASYSYDGASQLTGLTYTNGATTLGNLTYSYDLAGRRTSVGGSLAAVNLPSAVTSAAYNANNQLTAWGSTTLSYDLNGNMTSDGLHTYNWDARNRLTQMDAGSTAGFGYDAFGRRTSKTILGGQTGFLYDWSNPVQELTGTTVTANLLTGGIDEYFTRTDSAGTRTFLSDALGSTLALTDSTGTLQTQYTFEPFGNTTVSGPTTTNSFAYTGRELDATGLYFYRARYYNPTLQRFISEDPIGFSGGDVNLYAYTGNSPTNFVDPSGKSNSVIHLAETYLGARDAGLGFGDSLKLAGLAVASDFFKGSQGLDAGDTNIHAMAGQLGDGRSQTQDEAYQGTIDAVNTFASTHDIYGDALAVHAIADSYSGSHNYQPDNDPNLGIKPNHFFPDLVYHPEARDDIANYLRDRLHGRNCDAKKYLNPPAPKPVAVLPLPL